MTDETTNTEQSHVAADCPNERLVMHWVIAIGGYGAFLFHGTEEEAEEMRKHKAAWEHGVGLKRPADHIEIETDNASQCWNHENFAHIKKGFRYACDCCA